MNRNDYMNTTWRVTTDVQLYKVDVGYMGNDLVVTCTMYHSYLQSLFTAAYEWVHL